MRRARDEALDELEPLLERLRSLPGLRETSRGVFYRGSSAFLHFHEDPTGTHADLKLAGTFARFRAQTEQERADLQRRVEKDLST